MAQVFVPHEDSTIVTATQHKCVARCMEYERFEHDHQIMSQVLRVSLFLTCSLGQMSPQRAAPGAPIPTSLTILSELIIPFSVESVSTPFLFCF